GASGIKIAEVIYSPGYSKGWSMTEGVIWTPELGIPWNRKYGVPHPDVVARKSIWYSDRSDEKNLKAKTKNASHYCSKRLLIKSQKVHPQGYLETKRQEQGCGAHPIACRSSLL